MFTCLLIGQLLYLAVFDCSLFARPIGCFLYFYCWFTSLPLGFHCFSVLPLLSHVLPAVYIHVSACVCSYSPPPPPPPSLSLPPLGLSVGRSVCLPVCLSVCLSVRLCVCLSVSPFLSPTPTSPLSLSSSPSFSTPSLLPPVFCVPSWVYLFVCLLYCFVVVVVLICSCFLLFFKTNFGGCLPLFSLLFFFWFFFHWILNTSRARFRRM